MSAIKTVLVLAVLAVLVVLAGCATRGGAPQPSPGANAPSRPQASGPARAPPPERPPANAPPSRPSQASSPAVLSLLGRAETLARHGRLDMAAATLERALDLAPRNAFVYQQLAGVRLAQGQTGQAKVMARKSNSVAGDNPFVRAGNWRLIAEARRTAGDAGGARQATVRADHYRDAAQSYRQ